MLNQQNTSQTTFYEDEFPSLSGNGSKNFTNINLLYTTDSFSYCAKLKTSQHEKIKNVQTERENSDDSLYKPVASKSIQTPKQDLTNNCFKSQRNFELRNLSKNNSKIKTDSQLLTNKPADDQELVTSTYQRDEKDNGWTVVKKKISPLQSEENSKVLNKSKADYSSHSKSPTISSNNSPLPKYRTQNMNITSKKKCFYDSKIAFSSKPPSLQNKVTDSGLKNKVSNNSKNFRFQFENVKSGKSVDFKKVEAHQKPKYTEDLNKQSKNISSHANYSHAVTTFNKQNPFAKERNSSQNEKQNSPFILQKEQLSILNANHQKSFVSSSNLNKEKAVNFHKNNSESNKKLNSRSAFAICKDQNKLDRKKKLSSSFENQYVVENNTNFNKSILGSSKKKRKSKVKRQAAMQSDKIRIITPEMYSKIMNSSNDEKVHPPKNVAVNIYDSNEYPELGSSLISENSEKVGFELFSKKDTPEKFNLTVEKNDIDSGIIESQEKNSEFLKGHVVSVESHFIEDEAYELKKLPVHYNNPITISLYDMLSVNKSRKKEAEKSKELPGNLSSKISLKKQMTSDHNQVVNPLDSSKPAVKRGKEREKPKPKRLSKFKKKILLDREKRKEQILKQYMWSKLIEEKDVSPPTSESSEITHDKDLMKSTASNFSSIEMQHPSGINNKEETFINVKSGNLYSSLENNVNIRNQDIDSYATITHSKQEIKSDTNFCEEKLVSKKELPSTESTEIFVENAISAVDSQMYSKITVSKIKLGEREKQTKEFKFHCEKEVCDFSVKELEHVGEFTKFPTTARNHFSNLDLIDKKGCVNSLTTIGKDICYKSSLNKIEDLFEKCDALKRYPEENNFDEILCDIQYLFLHEGDMKTFSSKEAQNKLPFDFIKDFNSKTSNNSYNLSIVDIHTPEKYMEGGRIETVCNNLENTGKTYGYEKSDTETDNIMENRGNCRHHIHSDKEIMQAAYIILHSKKFRDYCNHFASKNLGETVIALLDDLTRFQDRMHQKDPIKARMKRRLIYGIKEIKRHVKLKKLKCIIIATDIEDSKTEGSLNDIVNELKTLAKDYHTPCVFSHLRKKLGQVCHKPAPVSAVGVINYEGSEINFKKMIELHSYCKMDYEKVLKSLLSKLTDVQVELLLMTKAKDPASLHSIVLSLLKELFSQPNKIDKSNHQNIEGLPEVFGLKGCHESIIDKDAVEANEINNILIKYNVLS